MKKFIEILLKTIVFLTGWAACIALIPIPSFDDPAIWRLWAEAIPFAVTALITAVFCLTEKRRISLLLTNKPLQGIVIGAVGGCIWLAGAVMIMYLFCIISFHGNNHIPLLEIWFYSVFINSFMQELLIRGYLYQMIKAKYNITISIIITTGLFTLMHGGAFEAGTIPVCNVITMSLFMTAALECTKSLWTPAILHFTWNALGSLILGGVSLADDYPHLLNMTFSGSPLLSGGIYKIEGSIIVLFINILLLTVFIIWKRRKAKPLYKDSPASAGTFSSL